MHLILHDLAPDAAQQHLPAPGETIRLIAAAPSVKPCAGCYRCWTKTPGECVIPDRGQEFCRLLAQADKLTLVSRCCYGGLSPDIKAMLDRHIGYVLPWFHIYEGEMHHVPRYERRLELDWHLYGDITGAERETARLCCEANARNMHAAGHTITFHGGTEEAECPHITPENSASPPKRIAFINGSPRKSRSATAMLLRLLEERLPGCEIVHGWDTSCSAYVIAFPLYVDGIPSGLLRELAEHEQGLPPGARVYAIVNNGFYEGVQNAAAIAMVRNWCARAGLIWGRGAGIGAGELLKNMPASAWNLFGGEKLHRALDTLAGHVLAGDGGEDIFITPKFPRALYMRMGAASFRLEGKKNGLTKREMEHRLD